MNIIRSYLKKKTIWEFIDEKTNINCSNVSNIITDTLKISNMFLFNSKILKKSNQSKINCKNVDETLSMI